MSRLKSNKKKRYLDSLSPVTDPYLEQIVQAVKAEGVERMQISSHEAQILGLLVRISQAKKVVEIGSLYGYSCWHIAQALPLEAEVWTLDLSPQRHKKAQEILKNSPVFKKIHWLTGQALHSLKSIESLGPFDMLFIDADKPAYKDYLNWAEKHLKPGALLVADNTFLFGSVYGEPQRDMNTKTIEIMKNFNQRLCNSPFWKGALIPTTEGLTVSIKQK